MGETFSDAFRPFYHLVKDNHHNHFSNIIGYLGVIWFSDEIESVVDDGYSDKVIGGFGESIGLADNAIGIKNGSANFFDFGIFDKLIVFLTVF